MAHLLDGGGGGSASGGNTTIVPTVGPQGRGTYPRGIRKKNYTDLDSMIAQLEDEYRGAPKGARKAALGRQLRELSLIRENNLPRYRAKTEKETTLDDIAKILLAIAGFGSIIPGPYGTAYKTVARAGRRYARTAYNQRNSTYKRSAGSGSGNYRKPSYNQYGNRR